MNHRFEIRHIPLWPAIKLVFLLLLVVGILFAVLYAVIMTGVGFLARTVGETAFGEDFGILKNLGFVMIPVIAILYAVFGTIAGVIWIVIYNCIASVVGGVELELKPCERRFPEVQQQPFQGADASQRTVTDSSEES